MEQRLTDEILVKIRVSIWLLIFNKAKLVLCFERPVVSPHFFPICPLLFERGGENDVSLYLA